MSILRTILFAVLVDVPSLALSQVPPDCSPDYTHVVEIHINTSEITTKDESGKDLELSSLRSRLARKLKAAGIGVVDGGVGPVVSLADFPATQQGAISLKLRGHSYEVLYRPVGGGDLKNFYSGVTLHVDMTMTLAQSSHESQFDIDGADWTFSDLLPTTAASAPFDSAVLESPGFLKELYARLAPIVGPTKALRAVIDAYDGYYGTPAPATVQTVHDVLREVHRNPIHWLMQEIEDPCDSVRRRAVNILPEQEYEHMFRSDPPPVLVRVADACRPTAGGLNPDLIPDLVVVLTTAESESLRHGAAHRLARICATQFYKGNRDALQSLRNARDQASGRARDILESELESLDPFYLRPSFVFLVILGVIFVTAIGMGISVLAQRNHRK